MPSPSAPGARTIDTTIPFDPGPGDAEVGSMGTASWHDIPSHFNARMWDGNPPDLRVSLPCRRWTLGIRGRRFCPLAFHRPPPPYVNTIRTSSVATAALLVGVALPRLGAQQAPVIPPAATQIAAAITPLPEELKADATVLGYVTAGKLVTLRAGKNDMICLAPDPAVKDFHSACYHKAMEPFMARKSVV